MNSSEVSLKILLIEDNQDLAEMLCSIMNQMGHEAMAAYNVLDGLEKSKEMKPGVILCDRCSISHRLLYQTSFKK